MSICLRKVMFKSNNIYQSTDIADFETHEAARLDK